VKSLKKRPLLWAAGCGACSERARLVPDGCSEGQTGEAGRNRLADTASSATPRVSLRSGKWRFLLLRSTARASISIVDIGHSIVGY